VGRHRWVKPFGFIHNHNLEKLPNSAPYRAQYFVPNAGECGISGRLSGCRRAEHQRLSHLHSRNLLRTQFGILRMMALSRLLLISAYGPMGMLPGQRHGDLINETR
jgi:hypothetical protein